MPAYALHRSMVRPRERAFALAAVVLVQLGLGLALLKGLHVDISRPGEVVQLLIQVTLAKPPPPIPPLLPPKPEHREAAAPKAEPDKLGGSPGPKPAHAPPS